VALSQGFEDFPPNRAGGADNRDSERHDGELPQVLRVKRADEVERKR
jgi:hypothetical protein